MLLNAHGREQNSRATLEGFPWELRTPEPREGLCVSLLGDPQDHATFCLPTLQEVLSLSPESCVIMVLPPAPAYILICSSYMNGSFMGRDPPTLMTSFGLNPLTPYLASVHTFGSTGIWSTLMYGFGG